MEPIRGQALSVRAWTRYGAKDGSSKFVYLFINKDWLCNQAQHRHQLTGTQTGAGRDKCV